MDFNEYHMELGKFEMIAEERSLDVNITRMANAFYHQLDLKYGKIEPTVQKEGYKKALSDRYKNIVGKVKETIDCKIELEDILSDKKYFRKNRRANGLNRLRKICKDIDSIYNKIDEMKFAYFKRKSFRKNYNEYMDNLEEHLRSMPKYILEGANHAYQKMVKKGG